ncbi:hypothetical protein ZWY2020_014533 [Hordeum vulgare]|nr:hypothetical protein ZWY2020_014533 [Hordeum vulgare]
MVKGCTGQRVRLYVRGTIFGYKRSKLNQYDTASLVQIEGVNTREDVAWYGDKITCDAASRDATGRDGERGDRGRGGGGCRCRRRPLGAGTVPWGPTTAPSSR